MRVRIDSSSGSSYRTDMSEAHDLDEASTDEELYEGKLLEGLDSSVRDMTELDWEVLRITMRQTLDQKRRSR